MFLSRKRIGLQKQLDNAHTALREFQDVTRERFKQQDAATQRVLMYAENLQNKYDINLLTLPSIDALAIRVTALESEKIHVVATAPLNVSSSSTDADTVELGINAKEMKPQSHDPILGQEAICPDGLGRVVAYATDWIQVKTYVKNRECKWGVGNVTLIAPNPFRKL